LTFSGISQNIFFGKFILFLIISPKSRQKHKTKNANRFIYRRLAFISVPGAGLEPAQP